MAKPQKNNSKQVPEKDLQPSEISQELIARRAYLLYLARGAEDGHDIDDWLQAERELVEGVLEQQRDDNEVGAA
jgi:Protein of unknown function (DUF2934)